MLRTVLCWSLLVAAASACAADSGLQRWEAWLEAPIGRLEFELYLDLEQGVAEIHNAEEIIQIADFTRNADTIEITFEYYEATLRARLSADGNTMQGLWRRRFSDEFWARLIFHARRGDDSSDCADPEPFLGRWDVEFADLSERSVLVVSRTHGMGVSATVLNTTGDYRYLGGCVDGNRLRLSRFDGAHAFVLEVVRLDDGTLTGKLSEGSYRETVVSGFLSPEVQDPPSYDQLDYAGSVDLDAATVYRLGGGETTLAELTDGAKAVVIEILGSWCPNCHDASRLLDELQRRYVHLGLRVVGLAFELNEDAERNRSVLRRYQERHELSYPIVLGFEDVPRGPAAVFPTVEGMFSFPTVLFLHGDGRIRTVHTGFTGPATGDSFVRLKRDFDGLVVELLGAE